MLGPCLNVTEARIKPRHYALQQVVCQFKINLRYYLSAQYVFIYIRFQLVRLFMYL